MSNPLQETQELLIHQNPFLGALLKSTSDRVICFNNELQITAWNPAMVQATGLSRADAQKRTLPGLFSLPEPGRLADILSKLVSENKSQAPGHILLRSGSQSAWFSASFYPLPNAMGQVEGGFALLQDAPGGTAPSHRAMVAEQALSLVKATSQQLICTLSTTGKLLEVSGNCRELLGYSSSELAGQPVESLLHPDDIPAPADGGFPFLDEEAEGAFLHRLQHKNGEYVWFESISRPVRHPETSLLLEVVAVCSPLQGHRLPTGAAARNQAPNSSTHVSFLELALEAASTGVWSWHAATEECEWDSRMQQLCGLEPGTFDGRFETFLNLLYSADRQIVQQAMRNAVLTGVPYQVDFRVERPDKSLRYITAMGRLLYLPNGTPDQLVGLCVDITDQKLAEQKVLEQQALLKSVLDSSLSGIVSLEPVRNTRGLITDFTIRLINTAGAAMARCTIEEAKGQSFLKLFPGARQEGIFDYYSSVAETGEPVSFETVFVIGKKKVWYAVQAAPLQNGLTATLTNINDQKESQLELLSNKYFLDKVNQTAPFLTAVVELNKQQAVYSSKKLLAFLGLPGTRGQRELPELLHPEDAARLPGCLKQVASAADYDVLRFLFRLRDRFQNYRWHQVYLKVFKRDAQGHVQEILCLLQEVDQPEQNKQLVNAMLDSSLSGIMAFESVRDQEGKLVDFKWVLMNKPAEQMVGRKARNVVGKGMMAEMPGNLSEGIFQRFAQVVETGEPVRFEHYHKHQGSLTWFEISAVKMGDGFTATFTDITGRKEADWQLLENQLFNQKITDTTPSVVLLHELASGRLLYTNHQLTTMLGYPPDYVARPSTTGVEGLIHPGEAPRLAGHLQQLAAGTEGEVQEIELRVQDAHGQWRWMLWRSALFRRNGQGKQAEVLSVLSDIDELHQSVTQMNLILDASLSGICALKAIRNAQGEIVDFEWLQANQRTADLLGTTKAYLAGRKLLDICPWNVNNGLFDAYRATTETGQSTTTEVPFVKEGRSRCLQVVAVKLEDGLMAVTEDITEKKAAAELQRKADMLLTEARKVARLGLWELTPDTQAMHWSEELCQLLGAGGQCTNTGYPSFLNLMDAETSARFDLALQEAVVLGKPFTLEHNIATTAGESKRLITRGQLLSEEGQQQKLVGICMDITEVYVMQQKLERAKLLQDLSEAVPQIIWTTGPDGRAEFVNSHWECYSGQSSSPLPVCPIAEVAHPDDREPFIASFLASVASGQSMEVELRLLRADGKYRWHLIRIVPQRGQAGKPEHWYGTATESHELKTTLEAVQQLSRQLKESNEELQRANSDLDSFHYAASHDLKAPVNNISSLLSALLEELANPEPAIAQLLDLLQQSIARFKATVTEMTEVSMGERIQKEPSELVDIAALLHEVLADIGPLMKQEQAQVEFDLQVPAIRFQRRNLRSILYNLITNAIKYHAPGRQPHVQVQTRQVHGKQLLLSVSDNSIGIESENIPLVFELFRRVHSGIDGTGMGLYIVKKMVENSGGSIEVESKPGEGSTFNLYLPSEH